MLRTDSVMAAGPCGRHSWSHLWVGRDCELGLLKQRICAYDGVGGALCVHACTCLESPGVR